MIEIPGRVAHATSQGVPASAGFGACGDSPSRAMVSEVWRATVSRRPAALALSGRYTTSRLRVRGDQVHA